jgi:regulator of sigma E protease
VRPKGENDPDEPGGLSAASPWKRLVVLFAGPVMNLLTGVLLGAVLIYNLGEPITNKVRVSFVAEDSPAMMAGLIPGDMVLAVNGETLDDITEMQDIISKNLGQPVSMLIQRGDNQMSLSVTPRLNPPEGQGPLGVGLDNPTRPISPIVALPRGAEVAFENARALVLMPIRMLNNQLSPIEGRVVGYKGMFDIYSRLPSRTLFFMAISISLGVMNLLPIPALDGGRILMTLPEILFRKRIPPRFENAINLVGFALLIVLLIYVNLQDFINPIQLP